MGCVELINFIHEECDYQNQQNINTDKPTNSSISIPNTAFQLLPDLLRVPLYTDLLRLNDLVQRPGCLFELLALPLSRNDNRQEIPLPARFS
jgi:hypothetical protein